MDHLIRVLVVEGEAFFRRGLIGSLEGADGFSIVGATSDAEEAYRLTDNESPAVALLGTTLMDASGIQLATEFRRRFPAVATILLSHNEHDDEFFAALRAGAAAYCGRNVDELSLQEFIRRAASGEYVINEQLLSKPYVAARVLDQFRTPMDQGQPLNAALMPLTDRELQILREISTGHTNAQIGDELGISSQTVKNHVTSILRKLAVNDRTQAVVTALKRGWITLDDDVEAGDPGLTSKPTSRLGSDLD
ncbi:MAG: response regulator transcription factor [Chloroflexia bacterium]|jgi:DNA-binding NarL/FixJ family response regulator|nr:response regulator transcription factor [Chloroflexia bacterium]MDQ3613384.1 response regulator transcription factor [Chloroflexota bacterium]